MRYAIGAALAAVLAASPVAAQDIDEREFAVVGTWGNLFNWKEHESRMWNEVIPAASGGKLTANAKPYTELGLSGYEVVKQLEVGAYDAAHALTTYTSPRTALRWRGSTSPAFSRTSAPIARRWRPISRSSSASCGTSTMSSW